MATSQSKYIMGLSFRTARRIWMGIVATLSLICIFLALVLWAHGYGKSNNLGALIAIPGFAFAGAVWTIFRKKFLSPQIVSVEATWVSALLPFQILLGLFVFESAAAGRSSLGGVYQCLVAVVWTNVILVFVYAASIILLALSTQFSYDQEVWSRDIDSSPCPFPFTILLVYAFPSTAKYFPSAPASAGIRFQNVFTSPEYCLPGCLCHNKISDGFHLDTHNVSGDPPTTHTGSVRSLVPIRVPTAMERQNHIPVTLNLQA